MSPTYTRARAVDDDPILVQVLTAFFAQHGVSVLTAHNGTVATALLSEHDDIDLIISDIHMPDSNGIEFMQHLGEAACRFPLVIASSADNTAMTSAEVLAKAYQLNFIGAVPKPINFGALAKLLGLVERA